LKVAQRRDETLAIPLLRRSETAIRQQLDGRQSETQLPRRWRVFRRLLNYFNLSGNPAIPDSSQPFDKDAKRHINQAPLIPHQHCMKCVYKLKQGNGQASPASLPGQISQTLAGVITRRRTCPMYDRRSGRSRDCTAFTLKNYMNIH
jgi:hypothetical protein